MLYEVITIMLTDIHPKLPMRNKAIIREFYLNVLEFQDFGTAVYDDYLMLVITSYSIHYTKLYESKLRCIWPATRRPNPNCPPHWPRNGPGIGCHPCGPWLPLAPLSPPNWPNGCRITSYNVCYTKLLRLLDNITHAKTAQKPKT